MVQRPLLKARRNGALRGQKGYAGLGPADLTKRNGG
jgi:hypothetical protein